MFSGCFLDENQHGLERRAGLWRYFLSNNLQQSSGHRAAGVLLGFYVSPWISWCCVAQLNREKKLPFVTGLNTEIKLVGYFWWHAFYQGNSTLLRQTYVMYYSLYFLKYSLLSLKKEKLSVFKLMLPGNRFMGKQGKVLISLPAVGSDYFRPEARNFEYPPPSVILEAFLLSIARLPWSVKETWDLDINIQGTCRKLLQN